MKGLTVPLWVVLLLLTGAHAATPNPDSAVADKIIDDLFGERVRVVRGTREADDDLALAEEILEAARKATDQPMLVRRLCAMAHDLSVTQRDGLTIAIAALRLSLEFGADPDTTADTILDLLRKRFTASRGEAKTDAGEDLLSELLDRAETLRSADNHAASIDVYQRARALARSAQSDRLNDVEADLAATQAEQRGLQTMATLIAQLKQNPDDAETSARLIDLLVIEMDAPERARRYSFLAGDNDQSMIKIAAKNEEDITPEESFALGRWYQDLTKRAKPEYRPAMLRRTADHFERYLASEPPEGLERTGVELASAQVTRELETLAAATDASTRDVTYGLIARWGFDNSKRLGLDDGRKTHGKPTGPGVKWAKDARRGGVLAFDGTGDHLILPHNPQAGHRAGSWTFWVRTPTAPATGQVYIQERSVWIAQSGGGYGIDLHDGEGWFDTLGGQSHGAIIGKGQIEPETWNHIAFTWDGRILRGYLNGRQAFEIATIKPKIPSQKPVQKLGPGGAPLAIGSRGTAATAFRGEMDDLRLYARPLSSKEIIKIVKATAPRRR